MTEIPIILFLPMRKILVCQHVAYEPLGTLNPLLKQNGLRIRYVNFGRDPHAKPDLEDYYGLIILGGPMSVWEEKEFPFLKHEIKLIAEAIKKNLPVLGVCLGAQLIAKALGAEVGRHTAKEIGWYDVSLTDEGKKDRLLKYIREQEKIFQWHQDTFTIPKDAVLLATTPMCNSQAFRFGEKVYGLQFHLEADEGMIERWLKIPRQEKFDPDQIRVQTETFIERSKNLSHQIFGEFINLFGVEKKRKGLSSR